MHLLPGVNVQGSQHPSTAPGEPTSQKGPLQKRVFLMDNEQPTCPCGKEQIVDNPWTYSPIRHGPRQLQFVWG